jgi:RNA polymerase sigma factor (sigma-70 family)
MFLSRSTENRRHEINQPLPEAILYLQDEPGEPDYDVEKLHQFIRELKEIDRAVIILYLEGNNQQEIAEVLGLTVTNVSTKVSRIKQQLKQKFSTQ